MANPAATPESKSSYDVFLSFRGEDTRHTFTGYLYEALCRKGINVFMDNENLSAGETIGPQLLKAIEESKVSFIVFSENYAASPWCLDELVKIMQCKKVKNQLVCPIFYRVEPSDVRRLKNSYGKAMEAHEIRFGHDSDKVKKWRSALSRVANISGFHLKEGYEFKFIQDIVSKAATKVSPKQLHIEDHLVGLQFRVAQLKSLLDVQSDNTTFMLGIHGTGGIGKTTLAKALFNSISNQFEGACFLFNVRETSNQDNGKVRLQQMLLSEMLDDGKIELGSVEKGISTIKDRLSTKRVLIVLDDVDKREQLNKLAGGCDWFGSGSRIIITTRDKYLLVAHEVKETYEMELLGKHESLELFCQNAFKTSSPATNYEDLSIRAIRYAKGLPLASKVIGSNLIDKDLNEWKSALDKYEKNPHRDIQSILRVSYDSLESNEKDIFLDIACFFNGQKLEYIKRILDGCEFYTEDGIRILVDKSLITVEDGHLRMHDLIQDMGRDIVKLEAPKEAGERSRLWFLDDVLEVLTENTGTSKIGGIKLDCPEEVKCIDTAFEKMKKLRILIIRNASFSYEPIYLPNQLRLLDWKGYPSKSFPPDFYPKKIAAINLRCSPLVLEKPFQRFERLTYMNFSYCQSITQFPEVSRVPNLRKLILRRCKKLIRVDESVGFLPNLVYLSASECTQLISFLPRICLPSLEYLSLDFCRRLAHFPDVVVKMNKPLKICIKYTAIRELPYSFADLIGLRYLDMTSCKELQNLPSSLFMLPKLDTLKIGGCSQLRESLTSYKGILSMAECWPNIGTLHFSNASLSDEDLLIIMQSFPNLKDLNVSLNYFASFPTCRKVPICLTSLNVSYCLKLQEIPELPSGVQKVDARHCNSLTEDTSIMLWSQVRKEINRLEIVMPKIEIPEWWDYCDRGCNLNPIFWARGKFPAVALALVFDRMSYQAVGLHLFINGEHVHVQRQQYHNFNVAEDHVLLFDLRVLFSDEDLERLDARFGHFNDWKRVQVKCETDMIPRQWGVYVYKQETNMSDIRFTWPLAPMSSVTRSLKVMIPREVEEEEGSATSSSQGEDFETSIEEDEASSLEHDEVLDHSNPYTGTYSRCCFAILSTFKRLLFRVRSIIQDDHRMPLAPPQSPPSPPPSPSFLRSLPRLRPQVQPMLKDSGLPENNGFAFEPQSELLVSTPSPFEIPLSMSCGIKIRTRTPLEQPLQQGQAHRRLQLSFLLPLSSQPSPPQSPKSKQGAQLMVQVPAPLPLSPLPPPLPPPLAPRKLLPRRGRRNLSLTQLRLSSRRGVPLSMPVPPSSRSLPMSSQPSPPRPPVPPQEQARTFFSESLQTLVENLMRLMAPRQEESLVSKLEDIDDEDDDYNLEWLAETAILSDDDDESYNFEDGGNIDVEKQVPPS